MFKKGEAQQREASIAILILLIALFILAYIVLLPEKSREALLEGDEGFDYSFNGPEKEGGMPLSNNLLSNNLFLKESPGIIGKSKVSVMEKEIGALNLNTETDTFSETLATVVEVDRNILNNNYQLLRFDIEDVGKIEEVNLLFFVKESKGRLMVSVNNHVLFFGVPGESSMVLKVPVERLKNSNQIEISTDMQKLYVWETNQYTLEDMRLVKKVLKDNRVFSKLFSVSESEIAGMSKAFIDYFVYCNVEDGGMMKVFMNNELMFSDDDLCSMVEQKVEIPKDSLRAGRNQIRFEVDKGNYRLEGVVVSGDLSDVYRSKYSFIVPESAFNSLKGGQKLKLLFKFPNNKRKTMIVTLNNHQINVDTSQERYEKVINSYVRLGENVVTLIPKTDVEVLDMEVKLG